jgi:hypothetical protein
MNLSKNQLDALCTQFLAPAIRLLTHLDISNNELRAKGGEILAKALNGNQVMAELDISDNGLAEDEDGDSDMSGIIALADAILGMVTLLKFTFSGPFFWSKPVTMITTMTEANFGGKSLGSSGSILVAAFLPKCT